MIEHIIQNNIKKRSVSPRKVIIVFWPEKFFLGDNVLMISYLRYIREFFENSVIDVNCSADFREYDDLLKNNPFVNELIFREWDDIDLNTYDIILLVQHNEQDFLNFLEGRYGDLIRSGEFGPAIYSYSLAIVFEGNMIFPLHHELFEFVASTCLRKPLHEFFIDDEEIGWGNRWMESQGVSAGDRVIVMIDETTAREKLLKLNVYFDILDYLLQLENVKILIFDKKGIDKEAFYKKCLDADKANRLIFARKLPLRESLSILSSRYIGLVFGPCTGLLHCAAGVCGALINRGALPHQLPPVIVYTGKYGVRERNAFVWWGKSLVNCWVLKQQDGNGKEIVRLRDIGDEKALARYEILPCSEYDSAQMISLLQIYKAMLLAPPNTGAPVQTVFS